MSAIQLETPVTKPATQEIVFDEIWLGNLHILATDPNAAVNLSAVIYPARTLEDGITKQLNRDAKIVVTIPDFFGVATEAELELMYSLISAIKARAGI